jgi:uncharacterized protein YggE
MMIDLLDPVQKNKLFKAVFAVFVLLAVFLGAEALNAIKGYSYIGRGTYAANVVTVTGTGEVLAVPDTGTFSFSVVEEGKTVGIAQDKASKKINAIIDAVKKMNVAEKDIKTTGYNSYPKYDYYASNVCANGYCPPGKQVLSGYEVSQTITLKIRDTAKSGDVLTTVGELGATNISNLDFVIDNKDAVQAEARDRAIADAKAKSKVLSKSLGVKLTKIVNFYESGNGPIYYGMSAMESKGMGGDMMPTVAPQVPTGENKITSNVTITYEVE